MTFTKYHKNSLVLLGKSKNTMKFHISWYSSDFIMTGSTIGLWWWWWWWWWWIVFLVWLTNKRCIALFPAGTTVRDPQHHESPTCHEQDLNMRKTWIQTLVEWSCTVVICVSSHIYKILTLLSNTICHVLRNVMVGMWLGRKRTKCDISGDMGMPFCKYFLRRPYVFNTKTCLFQSGLQSNIFNTQAIFVISRWTVIIHWCI